MNPLLALWNFALWFFGFALAVVLLPFSLLWSGTLLVVIALTKLRRRRLDAKYSWSANPRRTYQRSGYRRARYGYFN